MIPAWVTLLAEKSTIYGLIAAICFGAGWKVNGWRLGEGIANDQLEGIKVVRVIEQKSQDAADAAGEQGHAELDQARRDAATAAATANGLLRESRNLATRLASCNAESTAQRQARERAATVLADVLAEMESEGRGLAEIATRSRASGLACEAVYDGVSASMKKPR